MAERIVVGIYEAKTQLSKLIKQAAAGRDVVVENHGKPVARIVSYTASATPRKPGLLRGKVKIKPGFDDLPPGFDEAFGS